MHLNRCKWTTYEEFRIRQVPSAGNSRGLEVYHFQVRYISHIVPLRKHIEQILWCEWTNCLDDEDPMVLFAGVGDDADSVYLPLSPRLDGDGDRGEFGAVPMIDAGAEALTRSSMHNLNPHFGGAFSAIFKDKRELQGVS